MKIRSAEPGDAARLLEIYAYYVENTAITFECTVPSPDEFRRRIEETQKNYPYLVLEEGGRAIGYACASRLKDRAAYDRSCEVTVYLEHGSERKGYGRALYEALEENLKKQGVGNLYACIGDPTVEDEYLTKNSERFHRRLGYEKVGTFHKCGCKFGRLYNVIWMEKIIGDA